MRGLICRNGWYHYRRVIRPRHRHLFATEAKPDGQTVFFVALHTKDMGLAIERAKLEAARIEQIILRATSGPLADSPEVAADVHRRRLLITDLHSRIHHPLTDEALDDESKMIVSRLENITATLARGGMKDRYAHARLVAEVEALKVALQRNAGDFSHDGITTTSLLVVIPLSTLLDKWRESERPSERLHQEYARHWRALIHTVGDIPVQSLTKTHVRTFVRDELPQKKINRAGRTTLSGASITKALNAIKALLTFAVDQDFIKENIARGVTPPRGKSDGEEEAPRLPFSPEDLAVVFTSASRPQPRWLSTLALITGARLSELAHLRVHQDVKQENGVTFLALRPHEDRRLKSRSATRRLPIHRSVVEEFREYVKGLTADRSLPQDGPLFPQRGAASRPINAHNFSMMWGRWTNTLPLSGDRSRLQFHSLRHSFATLLRDAEVSDDIRRYLMGHSRGSGVSGAYGTWNIKTLSDAVNKITIPESVLASLR